MSKENLTFCFSTCLYTRTCVECHLEDQDNDEICDQLCSIPKISINTTAGKGLTNLPFVALL